MACKLSIYCTSLHKWPLSCLYSFSTDTENLLENSFIDLLYSKPATCLHTFLTSKTLWPGPDGSQSKAVCHSLSVSTSFLLYGNLPFLGDFNNSAPWPKVMLGESPVSFLFQFFNPAYPRAPSRNQHIMTLFWHMYLPDDPCVEQTWRIASSFQ